jgi:outer membrane protein TolC
VGETEAGFSLAQLAYRLGDAKLSDVIFQQRSLIDEQLAELAAQAELAVAQANSDLALGTWK